MGTDRQTDGDKRVRRERERVGLKTNGVVLIIFPLPACLPLSPPQGEREKERQRKG